MDKITNIVPIEYFINKTTNGPTYKSLRGNVVNELREQFLEALQSGENLRAQTLAAEILCCGNHWPLMIEMYKHYLLHLYTRNVNMIVNIYQFHKFFYNKYLQYYGSNLNNIINDQELRNHLSIIISTIILCQNVDMSHNILNKSVFNDYEDHPDEEYVKIWDSFIQNYSNDNFAKWKSLLHQIIILSISPVALEKRGKKFKNTQKIATESLKNDTIWKWLASLNILDEQIQIFKDIFDFLILKEEIDLAVNLIVTCIMTQTQPLVLYVIKDNHKINNIIDNYCLRINIIYKKTLNS